MWWHVFAEEWNGISVLWGVSKQRPDITTMLNASGFWDYGAFWQSNGFISLGLLHFNAYLSPQELVPIAVAAVDTEALLLQLTKQKLVELKQKLFYCILQKISPKENYRV